LQSVIESVTARYRKIGYRVMLTSTIDGTGIEELQRTLQHTTSVVAGESGVGKSSLIDILLPEQDLTVGALSESSGLGRHTTSVTTLFHLPHGGHIIDSPGVREFRLWRVAPDQLARGFVEFGAYLGRCRYRDCRHGGDAGCAIAAAVDEGAVDAQRLANYRHLLEACT
jgi:ribosome biogenesis GTPase